MTVHTPAPGAAVPGSADGAPAGKGAPSGHGVAVGHGAPAPGGAAASDSAAAADRLADQAATLDALLGRRRTGHVPPVRPGPVGRQVRGGAGPAPAHHGPPDQQPRRGTGRDRGWHLHGGARQTRPPVRRPGLDAEPPVAPDHAGVPGGHADRRPARRRCRARVARRRADPLPRANRPGPRGAVADRPADDQQVLRAGPRARPQHGRVPGPGRPAGVRDLLAQPGRAACLLGPGLLRRAGARRARRRPAGLPRRPGASKLLDDLRAHLQAARRLQGAES